MRTHSEHHDLSGLAGSFYHSCDMWDEYFSVDVNNETERRFKALVAMTASSVVTALKTLKISETTKASLEAVEAALLNDTYKTKNEFLDFIRSLKGLQNEKVKKYSSVFHRIALYGTGTYKSMPNVHDRSTNGGQLTPYGRVYLEHGHRWREDDFRQEVDDQWEKYRKERDSLEQ